MGTCDRDTLTVNGVTWHVDDNTACVKVDDPVIGYLIDGKVYRPSEVTVVHRSDRRGSWGLVTE